MKNILWWAGVGCFVVAALGWHIPVTFALVPAGLALCAISVKL
jgi:hypothetical protein